MELHSLNSKGKNEPLSRRKELAEIDSFNAMRAYLAGRMTMEEFEQVLDQLAQANLVALPEIKNSLLACVSYEGYQLQLGLGKGVLERAREFKNRFD